MWFDDIDIRADIRRYDGFPAGVAPTRQRIARQRRIAEIGRREREWKKGRAARFTVVLTRLVKAIADRLRIRRRTTVRTGMQPSRDRNMGA